MHMAHEKNLNSPRIYFQLNMKRFARQSHQFYCTPQVRECDNSVQIIPFVIILSENFLQVSLFQHLQSNL